MSNYPPMPSSVTSPWNEAEVECAECGRTDEVQWSDDAHDNLCAHCERAALDADDDAMAADFHYDLNHGK